MGLPVRNSIKYFKHLADTPDSYTGEGGKMVVVNREEEGLEFQEVEADVVEEITWEELGDKNGRGEVKIWDKYIITDWSESYNKIEVVLQDEQDFWYNIIEEGSSVKVNLEKVPKNILINLPSILRGRLERNKNK